MRTEASVEIDRLFADLTGNYLDWPYLRLAQGIERLDTLKARHAISISPEDQATLSTAREHLAKKREEIVENTKFQEELRNFEALLAAVEAETSVAGFRDADQMEARLLQLRKGWEKLKSYRRPVSEDLTTRLRKEASLLTDAIARGTDLRRKRLIFAVSTISVLVIALALGGYALLWARSNADSLHDFREARRVHASDSLLTEVSGSPFFLPVFASLRNEVEATRDWLTETERLRAATTEQATSLAQRAESDFAEEKFSAVYADLTALRTNTAALPEELIPPLAAPQATIDSRFANLASIERTRFLEEIDSDVTALESTAADQLVLDDANTPVAAIGTLQEQRRDLDARVAAVADVLPLTESLQLRLQGIGKRFDEMERAIQNHFDATGRLRESTTLEDYFGALASLQQSAFTADPAVVAAARVIPRIANLDEITAQMAVGNDSGLWNKISKETEDRSNFFPEKAETIEVTTLLDLRDSEMLSGIASATLVDHDKGTRERIFSNAPIPKASERGVNALSYLSWSGNFYVPSQNPARVSFASNVFLLTREGSKTEGRSLVDYAPDTVSSESRSFRALDFNSLLNDDGTEYRKSILTLLDQANSMGDIDPLFQGYILQRLAEIISLRPDAWGVDYSPSATRLLDSVRAASLALRLSDSNWMRPRDKVSDAKSWVEVFATPSRASFEKEARLNRTLIDAVRKADRQFAGYLDSRGEPQLLPAFSKSSTLWALSQDFKTWLRLPDPDANASEFGSAFAPMSPVISLPLDARQVIDSALVTAGIRPEKVDDYSILSPVFRFKPNASPEQESP